MTPHRYCQQCNRKLYPNEDELCRPCNEYNEMTLIAHEELYGHEEREIEEQREDERERIKDEPDFEELDFA